MQNTQPGQSAPDQANLPAASEQTELKIEEQPRIEDALPVQETEEAPQEGRKPNRHDNQMAAIVARRHERLERERAEAKAQGFQDQEPLEAPAPEVAPAPVAASTPRPGSPSPALESAGAAASSSPNIRRHRVTVRGQEYELADDEIRRAAELGIESEARMNHAQAMMQEAQRIASQHTQGAGQSPPAAPPPPEPQQPPENRDALLGLAKELLYGDEERVANALGNVMQMRSQAPPAPQMDPNALANDVYRRIDQRLGVQNSLTAFAQRYPHIVQDPMLSLVTANYVQALRDHHRNTQNPVSEFDLYCQGAEMTNRAVDQLVEQRLVARNQQPAPQMGHNGGPPLNQSLPMQNGNRLTIKRNMPQAPSAAAAQSAPQDRPEPSPRDVVNWMRRTRGQPELPPLH